MAPRPRDAEPEESVFLPWRPQTPMHNDYDMKEFELDSDQMDTVSGVTIGGVTSHRIQMDGWQTRKSGCYFAQHYFG